MDEEGCFVIVILLIIVGAITLNVGIHWERSSDRKNLIEEGYARKVLNEEGKDEFQMIPVPELPKGKWYYIPDKDSPVKQNKLGNVEEVKVVPEAEVYSEEKEDEWKWGSAKSFSLSR